MLAKPTTRGTQTNLENGCLRVFVDGHDDFRVLHAGQMLDGAGNADGDVELGGDNFARLADLHVVGHVAGVDGGTGSAHSGAQFVGKGIEHGFEIVAAL